MTSHTFKKSPLAMAAAVLVGTGGINTAKKSSLDTGTKMAPEFGTATWTKTSIGSQNTYNAGMASPQG